MNKAELVEQVATANNLTKRAASAVLDSVLDGIAGALEKGDKVSLVGFGSFEVRERAARSARNPHTGEPFQVPAQKVPVFKASKLLKEACK